MAYEVHRAAAVARDLELIFDFLVQSSEDFGDPPDVAFERSESRLRQIDAAINALGRVPHKGTRDPRLGNNVRHVTRERAIIYFETDDRRQRLRVLAVFFGGQNHDARIMLRLLSDKG